MALPKPSTLKYYSDSNQILKIEMTLLTIIFRKLFQLIWGRNTSEAMELVWV